LDDNEPQVIKCDQSFPFLPLSSDPTCRDWREKRAAEIKACDQASEAKRRETIAKAERAIDEFYEEYAKKTKRNIRENKCVSSRLT
jgi:hypothetical protein